MMSDLGPDLVPKLTKGRHRNPRRGACFMELASYLAGERWSDHPRCTHRLLAALARGVNDATTDAARPRLAGLAPAVVGLASDDPRWDVEIALRAAGAAIGVASEARQRVLAVGLLTCERVLDELDDRPAGTVRAQTRLALASAPGAEAWAREYVHGLRTSARNFASTTGPAVVTVSVEGIAEACIDDPDSRLYELLSGAIDECRTWAGLPSLPRGPLPAEVWLPVCRPVPVQD
jgi:hypothetical protein